MVTSDNHENKEIPINVFESLQIDFRPEKPKKRRNHDDYDYNDPFIEPFEGEFDAVELECKLENFFIHKGPMEEDPKRLAKKYRNTLKKVKLVDAIQNITSRENEGTKKQLFFEFEKMLSNLVKPSYKYKKDPNFENLIYWAVFIETPRSAFEAYLRLKILVLYRTGEFEEELGKVAVPADGFANELSNFKRGVEKEFEAMRSIISNDLNFSEDKKTFKMFSDKAFVMRMVNFIKGYMKFYAVETKENILFVRNTALDYLCALLPEQCTNHIKIKHYINKAIAEMVESRGYDLCSVKMGRFVKKEDVREESTVQQSGSEKEGESKNENGAGSESTENKSVLSSSALLKSTFPLSEFNSTSLTTSVEDQSKEGKDYLDFNKTQELEKKETDRCINKAAAIEQVKEERNGNSKGNLLDNFGYKPTYLDQPENVPTNKKNNSKNTKNTKFSDNSSANNTKKVEARSTNSKPSPGVSREKQNDKSLLSKSKSSTFGDISAGFLFSDQSGSKEKLPSTNEISIDFSDNRDIVDSLSRSDAEKVERIKKDEKTDELGVFLRKAAANAAAEEELEQKEHNKKNSKRMQQVTVEKNKNVSNKKKENLAGKRNHENFVKGGESGQVEQKSKQGKPQISDQKSKGNTKKQKKEKDLQFN